MLEKKHGKFQYNPLPGLAEGLTDLINSWKNISFMSKSKINANIYYLYHILNPSLFQMFN